MKNVFWYLFAAGLTLNLTGTIEWDWYLIIAPLIFGTVMETAIAIHVYRVKKAYQKAKVGWLEDSRKATDRAFQKSEDLSDHKRRIANHIKDR